MGLSELPVDAMVRVFPFLEFETWIRSMPTAHCGETSVQQWRSWLSTWQHLARLMRDTDLRTHNFETICSYTITFDVRHLHPRLAKSITAVSASQRRQFARHRHLFVEMYTPDLQPTQVRFYSSSLNVYVCTCRPRSLRARFWC